MKCIFFSFLVFIFGFQVSAGEEPGEAIPMSFNIPDYLEANAINLFGSVENARG